MKKIFFGWYIVAAALVLWTYNSAVFAYGFTAFVTPIATTFGWGLAQLSLAASLRGLETGALDPFIGIAADRWPAKRLMLIGTGIFALGIFIISRSTNLAMFYGGFLVAGLGGAISITMVPTTVIARWFKRNMGKVNGILAVGFSLGGFFAPLWVKAIDAYGWQTTMLYLAFVALILGIPLSFLFRNRPEDYGLLPDGKAPGDVRASSTGDADIGVKEALKMRTFWYLGIAIMFQMTAVGSIAIYFMPYLTSLGIARPSAAIAVTIFSIVGIAARLLYGVFADIFSKKYVLALSMGIMAVGLVIFEFLDGSSFAPVVLFAIIYGIGAGGATPLRAPIIREYFGVKNFGTIFGALGVFLTIGVSAGPPLIGWVFDIRGTYASIWLITSGLTLVGMILTLILPRASKKLSPVVS